MKTLLVVMAIATRITSLDPFSLTGIETFQATSNVIEPLARSNPTTKELIPWLAESWSVDAASGVVKVKLRGGVKFHNGKALSADDVKFTFEAYRRAEYKAAVWRPMWEDIQSCTVTGPLTLEFKLNPVRYLAFENLLLSLRILPRSFYEPAAKAKFRAHIVGTGPFKQKRFDSGRALELEPFKEWWGKERAEFNLLIKTVPDPKLAEEMMNKGELDYYLVPSAESVSNLKLNPKKFRLYTSQAGKGEGLAIELNLRRDVFKDPNVRRALLILWDRESLNQKIYGGRYKPALDVYSAKMDYYPEGKPEKYDPAKARELLQEAGWKDTNKDGVLDKNGQDLTFTISVTGPESERWVSLYQADAAKAGVKVKIKRLEEDSQWWAMLREGRFDAVEWSGGASEGPHPSTVKSDGAYNFTGYADPDTDRLVDELEKEFDLKKRRALQAKLISRVRAARVQLPGLYTPGEQIFLSLRLDVDPEFPSQPWKWRLKH